LIKVQDVYHEVFPEEIAWSPEVTDQIIRNKFKAHDPSPENLKKIWENADALLNESINLNPDKSKLKPREHKAYLQVQHFLQNTFGFGYLNYKAGLWLLGPSSFCSEPICYLAYAVYNSIGSMAPSTEDDVYFVENHLKDVKKSIYTYIDVLKMGIKKGMVRTHVECVAGIDAMKSKHPNITENGPKGIVGEWYVRRMYEPLFYNNVTIKLDKIFVKKHGKNVTDYILGLMEPNIGKPIHDMLQYLEYEHLLYCRPTNVGPAGLSALPLDYVWYKGNKTTNRTDPYLPDCGRRPECRLNGSVAYELILGYFTTKDIHPLKVNELGWENLYKLYPQVEEIARNVTGIPDTEKAVKEFQKRLTNHSLSYFHDQPLPENETKGDAFSLCKNEESAKIHCPNRWKAMMKWFSFAQMAMSMHDPNTVDFFYFTGEKKSTPSCPVKLRPDFNPSSGAQSYDNSDPNCTYPCFYNIPFFLEDLGPKFSEYSVNAHEARPGHHTQVQGLTEHFRDKCGGPEGWLDDKTFYTAFTEGWALYAENPLIAQDTDVYKENLMQKFGMLKWQIWRALRLIVDTGIHYKGMNRTEALSLFEKYAWDATDLSQKEVTRYQSNYGQATAYMIGQLDIWKLRNDTEDSLGHNYSIKEFHLQALSQGSSPLQYLKSYMMKFIDCKNDPSQQYCDVVLNPTKASKTGRPYVRNNRMKWPTHRHHI